ncbi:MAG TPA: glycosyltransferase family 39 protein [Polyangiaceae bacterium]
MAWVLGVVSLVLLAVRLFAATHVGFGDSEALYACYALHPQPAYLDHPGLVGTIARVVGGGSAPWPLAAHVVTSFAATAFPWAVALACRASGASWSRALAAGVVVALVPEIAVGLFALTPDLPCALAWALCIAAAATALRARPASAAATAAFAAAGLLAGIAAGSKVTGLTLLVALTAAYAAPPARAHARTVAPWAGLLAGLLVVAPVGLFEAHEGWPMLRHRLVDTQAGAGPSLRNVGAVIGGQLVYLSPLIAVLVVLAFREMWRGRTDAVGRLLLACTLVPLAVLLPLCLWSRVAEPHWIAPALLALVPAAARAPHVPSRRLVVASAAIGGLFVAGIHVAALTPLGVRLAPASADPRLDLTNELYGWPRVVAAAREEALAEWTPVTRPGDIAIVGPHWVVCAQLEAALRGAFPVGCNTPVYDDFDDWYPRTRWHDADVIVWVTDRRFGPPPELQHHVVLRSREVPIQRGGRVVRVFDVTVLVRRAAA